MLFLFFLNSPALIRVLEAQDDLCMVDGVDEEHSSSNLFDLKDSFKKSSHIFDFEEVPIKSIQASSTSRDEFISPIYLELISPPPKKD